MKLYKRLGVATLCAMAIMLGGCADSPSNSGVNINTDYTSSSFDAAFTFPDTSSQNEQSNNIIYFGNKDIGDISELYSRTSGGSVNVELCGEPNYTEVLSAKISSDNSPDLCDKVENTFPYLMSMNLYEDLTNYIDTTSPQWLDYTDVIERYSFKGGRFFYPTTVKIMPEFLIYVKTEYILCGNLPDPEKQWLRDEWTWNDFRNGAVGILNSGLGDEFLVSGNGVFDNFLATSGDPLFTLNGNRFVNNLESDSAYRLYDFLMQNESKYDSVTNATDEMEYAVFLSGDENTIAELRKTDLTIGVVPYPRYELADEYYCKAVAEGFLVPKGAKNIQAAASFINSSRISDASEEQQEKYDKELIKRGLLRSDVEWLRSLRSSKNMTPILVDVNCFDKAANDAANSLLTYRGTEAWADVLALYSPAVNSAIDNINAVIE